jgi:homoserine O-acetyltransferase
MDTFDPSRGFGSAAEAYGRIEAAVTLVGISSDWLFPAADVRNLATLLVEAGVRCDYRELVSSHGHDAFLAEPGELLRLLQLPE